jgi:hypothetical protein
VAFVGLLFSTLGAVAAPPAARLLLGAAYDKTEAANTFAVYAVYVACMACNGVTEAFATAASDAKRLASASAKMVAYFLLYAVTAAGTYAVAAMHFLCDMHPLVLFTPLFVHSYLSSPYSDPPVSVSLQFSCAFWVRPVL